jgi:hypothetical protein
VKKLWIILACILAGGLVVMGLVTKKQSPTANAENPYKFYYYPKLNTYYDFQHGDFVYTLDGGETWLKKKPANSQLPEKLSRKVMITGPIPEVWLYNEEHRQRYHGINTNYLTKDYTTADARSTSEREINRQLSAPDQETSASSKASENTTDVSPVTTKPVSERTPEEEWEQEMDKRANQLIKKATKELTKDVIEVPTWDSTEE